MRAGLLSSLSFSTRAAGGVHTKRWCRRLQSEVSISAAAAAAPSLQINYYKDLRPFKTFDM